VTEDDIARRAFELYCDRGRTDGHDVMTGSTPNANYVTLRVLPSPEQASTTVIFIDHRALERLCAKSLEMPSTDVIGV
jgi:hypothetical protein